MIKLVIGLCLLITVMVSAESFNGHKYYDKFTKETKYETYEYDLGHGIEISFGTVNNEDFYVKIVYEAEDWLFIRDGESLQLLLDDELFSINGKGSEGRRDIVKGGIVETAYYNVEIEDLLRIFNAKKVELKLVGDRYFITEKFRIATKSGLGKFLSYFNYINLADYTDLSENDIDSVVQYNKKQKDEQKAIKKAMNKELYSSKLFYAGNAFVIAGGIGILTGGVLMTIGIETDIAPLRIAGLSTMGAFTPMIPMSAIFYVKNYKDVKQKYVVSSNIGVGKESILIAVNVSF